MTPYNSYPSQSARTEVLSSFMRGVYGWMTLGLALTAALALFTSSSPAMMRLLFQFNPAGQAVGLSMGFWVLLIGEVGLVFYLSARIRHLSAGAATALFLMYSALNGVTLSMIFLAYAAAAIFKAFITAAGMFGAMSLYGTLTKKDLTSWGSFLMMGLIGLIIAMVVNMFLRSPAMDFVVSGIGVVLFMGLTAYDTQKLKTMGEMAPLDDATALRRGTIMGALTLYLDFVNLFLMLLRFFGGGRD